MKWLSKNKFRFGTTERTKHITRKVWVLSSCTRRSNVNLIVFDSSYEISILAKECTNDCSRKSVIRRIKGLILLKMLICYKLTKDSTYRSYRVRIHFIDRNLSQNIELIRWFGVQIKSQATGGFQAFIIHYREDPDQQNLIDWIQEDWVRVISLFVQLDKGIRFLLH